MKKVAIITLNGYFNYGNRVQNYALQEVLRMLDCKVETLIIDVKENKNEKSFLSMEKVKRIKGKSIESLLKRIERKAWTVLHRSESHESKLIRSKVFKEFTFKHLNEIHYTILDDAISEKLSDSYDYFITGSDQVWNPNYTSGSFINFLTFAEDYKRISYAASFGVSEIKSEFIGNYKEWISGMDKLSVREDDGAKIVKKLTGREAPVHVDPTLLLTKEKWISISKEASNKPRSNYLLTYFLDGVPTAYKDEINSIAKDNNLEVVNLGDIREKETYRTGPSEFIDYINSCSIFCTDSFHGAVFSILFEKPFIVYERIGTSLSMFSRINTLLDKFDLKQRKAENIESIDDVFNIDYSHVPPILEQERKKSLKYLKEALNIADED